MRGVSHIRSGTRLQDAKRCFEVQAPYIGETLVSIISDGAGSAEFGGQGASIACRTIASSVHNVLQTAAGVPSDDLIWSWTDLVRDRIYLAAEKRNKTARDFAATLVMFIASPTEVLTAHIGDGAIVARKKASTHWSVLSEPKNGEYASTTFFITDEPQPPLRIFRHPNEFDAIASFSDGIEHLVLDSVSGEPSSAFFNPVIRPLENSNRRGYDVDISRSLAKFLDSERLNERTDDDKTLVIAVAK